jgi:hypothetical protein
MERIEVALIPPGHFAAVMSTDGIASTNATCGIDPALPRAEPAAFQAAWGRREARTDEMTERVVGPSTDLIQSAGGQPASLAK